jgi:hypothetical protein
MLFETSAGIDVVPTFDAMRLKEDLLRGIFNHGVCVLALWCASPLRRVCIYMCVCVCGRVRGCCGREDRSLRFLGATKGGAVAHRLLLSRLLLPIGPSPKPKLCVLGKLCALD